MEQLEDLKNKIIEKYRDYIKNISYRFHLSYRAEDWFEFEIEFSKCNSNYNTITFNDTCENLDIKQLESLLINLTSNDLTTSCALTKISVDDFYKWYDEAKIDSEFYIKSSKIFYFIK